MVSNWGTNEMGDHRDWPKLGGLMKGGPICSWGLMNWGTNEMGDQ